MKKRDLIEALSQYSDDTEIGLPCGRDTDGELLYSEAIVIEDFTAPIPSGVDVKGNPVETMEPMVILLPGDGPMAQEIKDNFEGDDEEEEGECPT